MSEIEFTALINFLDVFVDNFRLKGLENIVKILDVTEENIQARVRAVLLMAVSNKYGNILLIRLPV